METDHHRVILRSPEGPRGRKERKEKYGGKLSGLIHRAARSKSLSGQKNGTLCKSAVLFVKFESALIAVFSGKLRYSYLGTERAGAELAPACVYKTN